MYIILYNIFLFSYKVGIRIASIWDIKARQWMQGRKDYFKKLSNTAGIKEKIIWVHCSSLGEFEQASPLLDKLKILSPSHKIFLTFFSPSGYKAKKKSSQADYVFYLPLDSKKNAEKLLRVIDPQLVIFVKYEYWFYYLESISKRKIPILLVSAIFRKDQPFFKWYGALHRRMLSFFTHIFVQNEESKNLVEIYSPGNVTVSGDTRFDRVVEVAENFLPVNGIDHFSGQFNIIVAGSTWPDDENLISRFIKNNSLPAYKWILVPHETTRKHLDQLRQSFPGSIFYSSLTDQTDIKNTKVLIIDNVGMLSRLYKYATVAYIGGGFGKEGVHNVLEAAVYGKPIIFGPVYYQFYEAQQLVLKGGAITISNYDDFVESTRRILNDKEIQNQMGGKTRDYVYSNKGATGIVVDYIQENRLLTN